MTLTDFLLARIAEDEAAARPGAQASISDWEAEGCAVVCLTATIAEDVNFGLAPHIANWEPARVLADCEAKRRIMELRDLVDQEIRRVSAADHERATDARNTRLGLDMAIKALALPYADHPEFREEWRP
jgi:uncharacterized membrane protein